MAETEGEKLLSAKTVRSALPRAKSHATKSSGASVLTPRPLA